MKMISFEKTSIFEICLNFFYLTIYGIVKHIPVPFGFIFRFIILKIFGLKGGIFWIYDGVSIYYPWRVEIGSGSSLNEGVYILPGGSIKIGNNTRIAQRTSIISTNHIFKDKEKLIKNQGFINQPIDIGEDCWVGSNTTILSGSSIGRGSIIAAGAIVNKSFSEYCVIAGSPAKIIKKR